MWIGKSLALWNKLLAGATLIFILAIIYLILPIKEPFTFTRFAMGTMVEYTIMAQNQETARAAIQVAHDEIERVEHLFWEKDSSSEVYRFNRSQTGIETTREVHQAITRALAYSQKTDGAFDIAIKDIYDLYDFDDPFPVPPSKGALQQALTNVGYRHVATSASDDGQTWYIAKNLAGVGILTGGFAKGYAVDRAALALQELGISNAIINAGGDIVCLGSKNGKPWTVGILHPREAGTVIRTIALSDQAVATSGDYQKCFLFEGVRYHHILDPRTGQPSQQAQSVTVIAPTAEAADAWATAIMVMGPSKGMLAVQAIHDIDVYMVDSTGTVHQSAGFASYLLPPVD